MSKSRPKTAEDLRALVESYLATMPPDQQRRFWLLITEHADNWHHERVLNHFVKSVEGLLGITLRQTRSFVDVTNDLSRQLKKHRKPVVNAERDDEIMKLHEAGKSSGKIAQMLKSRYPRLTDGAVRLVITRRQSDAAKP